MGSQIPEEKNKSPVGKGGREGGEARERWRKRQREMEREKETLKKMSTQSNKASWDM